MSASFLVLCVALIAVWTAELGGVHANEIEVGYDIRNKVLITSNRESARVLFSMTTTLYIPEKLGFVEAALSSFIEHHPDHFAFIGRWLLVNEFSEVQNSRAAQALQGIRRQYPFIETYQKAAHEQGQARSLNIILNELRTGNYSHWLHIEESWRTVRPFLNVAIKALDNHPHLHQLQLYHADYYLNHTHTRIDDDIKVVALNSHVNLVHANPREWRTYSYSWPSYSLRPSLTQVRFLRDHPQLLFDTNPASFPVIFELDFAIKWQLLGGSMCALVQKAILRQEGHRSTYTLTS